jgi:hypothetical protein
MPKGLAFVTNQELTLGEREELSALPPEIQVEIYHMERIAALLDQPSMAELRQKFLGIDPGPSEHPPGRAWCRRLPLNGRLCAEFD